MTEYDGFRLDRDAERGVATITLDVPGKLNRVSMAARGQLAQLFAGLDADEAVRFVVLTGADGAFTAGGNIAGLSRGFAVGGLATRARTLRRRSGARSR